MKEPEKYLAANLTPALKKSITCPVKKTQVAKLEAKTRKIVNNELFYFC